MWSSDGKLPNQSEIIMKKKIVISEKVTAVMLAAAMAISMTACGSPAKDMQGAAETAADEETIE